MATLANGRANASRVVAMPRGTDTKFAWPRSPIAACAMKTVIARREIAALARVRTVVATFATTMLVMRLVNAPLDVATRRAAAANVCLWFPTVAVATKTRTAPRAIAAWVPVLIIAALFATTSLVTARISVPRDVVTRLPAGASACPNSRMVKCATKIRIASRTVARAVALEREFAVTNYTHLRREVEVCTLY